MPLTRRLSIQKEKETKDNQRRVTYSDNGSSIRPRLEYKLLLVCGFCFGATGRPGTIVEKGQTDKNEDWEERLAFHDIRLLIIVPARV
jgi:hypothetical protein